MRSRRNPTPRPLDFPFAIHLIASFSLALIATAPTRLAAASLSLIPPVSGSGSFWSAALWDSAGGNVSPGPGDILSIALASPPQLHIYLGDTLEEPARSSSVEILGVYGSQSVTIDGAGDTPAGLHGHLYLNQDPHPACRVDATHCSLAVDLDPGTTLELRDVPMLMNGDVEVVRGTLAITQTVDSNSPFGANFISPFAQIGGTALFSDPTRSTLSITGHGVSPVVVPTALIHALDIVDVDDTAFRLTDGAWLDVYHMLVVNRQSPSSPLPGTTRIEIGDALSQTARMRLATATSEGRSADIELESVGRELLVLVGPRGQIELTGDSSDLIRSNIRMSARGESDQGNAVFEIDGGLLEVTTANAPVIPSAVRYDVSVTAHEGGTAILRVAHGGELRGSSTALQRGHGAGNPLAPPGVARLEISSGGRISNGTLSLAGAALVVQDGALQNESLSLSDPLAELGQEPSQATWSTPASRLESGGRSLDVYSGSTARFEAGAVGTDLSDTQVGGSANGIPTGIATSRLELDAPGTGYDTGRLSIGLPDYSARYGGPQDCPTPFGTGNGVVEVTGGASLQIGNAHNDPGDPFGFRPSLALAPAHDEYAASELRLDATSAVVIAAAGSTVPQLGAVVVGQDGRLAGSGLINGDTLAVTPDLVTLPGGSITPGCSTGTLTIAGAYTQQGGELELEIAGAIAGEYDVLDAANGSTFLGGTIRFERIVGYLGDIGAQLHLFADRPIAIDASVAIVDNTGLGLVFDPGTGIATITQTVPEPSVLASLAAGLTVLRGYASRRRRR